MTDAQYTLRVSGFTGLAVGFSLELYRLVLRDPVVLGGHVIPEWLEAARLLLIGSVAVLFYAGIVTEVFEGWRDFFVGGALLAQWGVPVALSVDAMRGLGTPAGFLVLIAAALHAVVAAAAALTYARDVR